LLQIGLH